MSRRTKIFIVDDHPLVREGLAARISAQAGMQVCGEADDVAGTLKYLDTANPDLLIVDLSLKDSHGLDLIRQVRARGCSTRILVVSAYDESLFAERVLRAGAQGYINKQALQDEVIDAIRVVMNGQYYISSELASRLVGRAVGSGMKESGGIASLSDRELQVFQLIGQGESTAGIAEKLHLSIHTIETYREKIRAKLNLKSGTELMRRAIQWALESG